MKFKISVTAYNGDKFIKQCLESIMSQTLPFDCVLVDDGSTDSTAEVAEATIGGDTRFKLIKKEKNQGRMLSTLEAIVELYPSGEDVIVEVDGDDYLVGPKVLERVKEEYDNGALATYGQFRTKFATRGLCRPYSPAQIQNRSYRSSSWLASHLKTYKYFLFEKINKDNFVDDEGKPLNMVPDMAFMFPILEMVGTRVHCINDVLYHYRTDNPMCAHNLNVGEQLRQGSVVKGRPKYPLLEVNAYEV